MGARRVRRMLPPLSQLSLGGAPVRTGADEEGTNRRKVDATDADEEEAKRRKVDAADVAPSVLLGLPEDMWLSIMQSVDHVDVCNEIGRICRSANVEPLRGLCQKDSTYDVLNRKMGLYGDGGTLASMQTWAHATHVQLAGDPEEYPPLVGYMVSVMGTANFTARRLFEYVCLERKLVIDSMKRFRQDPTDKQKHKEYRLNIQTLLRHKSPALGAQAKWVVSLHPTYAFEFIPGSMTTQERNISLDLQPGLPYDDPVRERARQTYTIMRNPNPAEHAATWADIAVPNWVEIAKMAIENAPVNFEHVPGWIDHVSGYQPFPPCEGFAEIAKLAMEGHPYNFGNVPGSTLNPEKYASERFFPDAVSNYTELAKLAAKASYMLRHVPGSIDPRSGGQLRPPVADYYDIAEVHLRRRGWSLRYVPPDLPGYAALARIAIDQNPNAFKFVPMDHKDHKELEAHRDERVAKDL